ncbi:MAG: hypothetical protein AAFY56_06625, partial [Pseudomonadota bacterium]
MGNRINLADVKTFDDLTQTEEAQDKSEQHFRHQTGGDVPANKQVLYRHTGVSRWFGWGNTAQRQAKWENGATKVKKLINEQYDTKLDRANRDKKDPTLTERATESLKQIGNNLGLRSNEAIRTDHREHREQIRDKYFNRFADQLFRRINERYGNSAHFSGRDINKEVLGKDILFIKDQADILRNEWNRRELLDDFADGKLNEAINKAAKDGSEKLPRDQYAATWDKFARNLNLSVQKLADLKERHPENWQKILDGTLSGKENSDISEVDIKGLQIASQVMTLALNHAKGQKIDSSHVEQAMKDFLDNPTNRRAMVDNVNNAVLQDFVGSTAENYVESLQPAVDDWYDHVSETGQNGDISKEDIQWLKNEIKNYDSANGPDQDGFHLDSGEMEDTLQEMNTRLRSEANAYKSRDSTTRNYLIGAKVLGRDGSLKEAEHRKLPRLDDAERTIDKSSIDEEVKSVKILNRITKHVANPRELTPKHLAMWHGQYFREAIEKRHKYLRQNNPTEQQFQKELSPLPAMRDFVNHQANRGTDPELAVGKAATPAGFMSKWIQSNDLIQHIYCETPEDLDDDLKGLAQYTQLRGQLDRMTGGHYNAEKTTALKALSRSDVEHVVQSSRHIVENEVPKLRLLAKDFAVAYQDPKISKSQKEKIAKAHDTLVRTADQIEKELTPLTKLDKAWQKQVPKELLMRHPALLELSAKHLDGTNATAAQTAKLALASSIPKFADNTLRNWDGQRQVLDDFSTFVNTKARRLRELEEQRSQQKLTPSEDQEFNSLRDELKQLQKDTEIFKKTTQTLKKQAGQLNRQERDLFDALDETFDAMAAYFKGKRVDISRSAKTGFLQRGVQVHDTIDSRVGLNVDFQRQIKDQKILANLDREMARHSPVKM